MSFLYFAYGSNLLKQRIHINNPSAIRVGIGKLENFRLDFLTYSTRWKGASATVVPTPGSVVWGAIWQLNKEHIETLDQQEGVHDKIYFPLNVDIEMLDGSKTLCRVYQQCATPSHVSCMPDLPMDQRPSAVYLRTILLGAKESKLPEEYRKFLETIPHNGYDGDVNIVNSQIPNNQYQLVE
ncbi:hypothetical protein Trydic_g5775 [Trypoxylus dichotomus]